MAPTVLVLYSLLLDLSSSWRYQNNKIEISVLQDADHIKNTVVRVFPHIQYFNLMYFEVSWTLVSLGTLAWLQIILDRDNLPDYL